jgi:pimeloyl-ACP methyl ester carboxylesterase
LGDDVAGIIEKLGLAPVSLYGCSSGGQAVLSAGLYHPELFRNILVHEAALQMDAPLPNSGYEFFKNVSTFSPCCSGIAPADICAIGNYDEWMKLDPDFHKRIKGNAVFWGKYYLGTVDSVSYSAEDLAKMPNVEFSVGSWSPAWAVYANIETAERGNRPYTWLSCAHFPQVSCPEVLADYIRRTCRKYL